MCTSETPSFEICNKKVPWWYCDEDLVSAGIGYDDHAEEHQYDKFAPIGVFQRAVRIGPEFQAEISSHRRSPGFDMDYKVCDQPMWIPPSEDVCSADKLFSFLKQCESLRFASDALAICHPSPSSAYDNDDALFYLLAADYDVDRALAKYLSKIQLKN